MSRGKKIAELAKEADVNRSTIEKIEHLVGVSETYANRVFIVLKKWNSELDLDAKDQITTKAEKIESPFPISIQRGRSIRG